jgi:hypothetical protein
LSWAVTGSLKVTVRLPLRSTSAAPSSGSVDSTDGASSWGGGSVDARFCGSDGWRRTKSFALTSVSWVWLIRS